MTYNINNFSAIITYIEHFLTLLNNNLKLHLEKLHSFSSLNEFSVYLTIFPQTFCRNFCAAKKSISLFYLPSSFVLPGVANNISCAKPAECIL